MAISLWGSVKTPASTAATSSGRISMWTPDTAPKTPSQDDLKKKQQQQAAQDKQKQADQQKKQQQQDQQNKNNSLFGKAKQFIKDDVVKPTVKTVQKSVNTVGAGVAGVTGLATAGVQAATGNKKGAKATINATQQEINDQLTHGAGNAGSYLTPEQARKGGKELIKPAAQAVTDIAPLVLPGAAAARGTTVVGKVVGSAIDNAALSGATTVANEAIQGNIRSKEAAKETLKSLLTGAVIGGVGGLVHAGVKTGADTVSTKAARDLIDKTKREDALSKVRPRDDTVLPDQTAPAAPEAAVPPIEQQRTNSVPANILAESEARRPQPLPEPVQTAEPHITAPEPVAALKPAEIVPEKPVAAIPEAPAEPGKPLTAVETAHLPSVEGYHHTTELVKDYAEFLRSNEKSATVTTIADGKGGYKRVTEHSPFYRAFYKENGKPPTITDYMEEAKRGLESGHAAHGASDIYKHLLERENQPLPGAKVENTMPPGERLTSVGDVIAKKRAELTPPPSGPESTVKPETSPRAPDEPVGEKTTPKVEEVQHSKFKSRVYERLQKEQPEALKDDVGYKAINLKEDAAKAADIVATDKNKAYRIAMGIEDDPSVTSTAVSIAMSEKALEEGNVSLYSQLVKSRSLMQTRRGQEIVAEKGSVTDNSTSRYVKELLQSRLAKLGKGYLDNLNYKDRIKNRTPAQRAVETVDKEVAKAQKQVRRYSNMKVKEAQDFLDSLQC
jgi:hypothetical protein